MQLSTLRQIVAAHSKPWSIKNMILREPAEIRKIKKYLKQFKSSPAEYELTHLDLFDLFEIILLPSELPLIKAIYLYFRSDPIFEIFRLLHQKNLTQLLWSCQDLNSLAAFCLQLKQANVRIDYVLIEALFAHRTFKLLLEASTILSDPAVNCFNGKNAVLLLNQNYISLRHLRPVLKILQLTHLLNHHSLKVVSFSRDEIKYLHDSLRLLYEHDLIATNVELIKQLLCSTLSGIHFYKLIFYLNQSGILNQQTITSCLQLLRLSQRNIERLQILIDRLHLIGQLNRATFEAALQRVSLSLPRVQGSIVKKRSRKMTGLARSEMIVYSTVPPLRFFMEHRVVKNYYGGAFSTVKRGYDTVDSSQPVYSIKRFLKSGDPQREIKYHMLLGRQALWFSHNDKKMVVTEWQWGQDLAYFCHMKLKAVAYEKRLQCLISGLNELNILHAHYSVHGDIKDRNCIVDFDRSTMKLIDFGGSRKWGAIAKNKGFHRTRLYCDPQLWQKKIYRYSFCDDIYSMGIVIARLFPELFSVYEVVDANTKSLQMKKVYRLEDTIFEQAIITLVDHMMTEDRDKRCTSQDALDFCSALFENRDCLDDLLFLKIRDTFINRSNVTLEDVFRGAMRGV